MTVTERLIACAAALAFLSLAVVSLAGTPPTSWVRVALLGVGIALTGAYAYIRHRRTT